MNVILRHPGALDTTSFYIIFNNIVSCQRFKRNFMGVKQGRGSSIFVPKGLSLCPVSICFWLASLVPLMTRQPGSLSPILHLPNKIPKQHQDRNHSAWDKTEPHRSCEERRSALVRQNDARGPEFKRILERGYSLGNLTCYHPSTNFDFADIFLFSVNWRRT